MSLMNHDIVSPYRRTTLAVFNLENVETRHRGTAGGKGHATQRVAQIKLSIQEIYISAGFGATSDATTG